MCTAAASAITALLCLNRRFAIEILRRAFSSHYAFSALQAFFHKKKSDKTSNSSIICKRSNVINYVVLAMRVLVYRVKPK